MINVAIDGPAGAGKSTVAKELAKRLGFIYLDTGAMYRATAYLALESGIDVKDEERVQKMLETLDMKIEYEDGVQQIYVNGVNATPYLREHRMSKAASDISALKCVRYKMVELQREFGKTHDVVLDGRDIGTFVLPNANCKLFLTATPEVRAKRRYDELLARGEQVDFDKLLADIVQRDYNDSHREVAPLKQAEDAELLDTSDMDVQSVVSYVIDKVQRELAKQAEEAKGEEVKETPEEVNREAHEAANSEAHEEEKEANKPSEIKEDQKKKGASDRLKKYYTPLKSFGFFRFIRTVMKPVQKLVWPIKLINPENARKIEGRAIYICNHYSKVDTFLPCVALFKREAHILAKAELFEAPIPAWFLYHMGAIPVKRGSADVSSVKCILSVLNADKQLLIFPEGTRNRQGTEDMAELKQGAARFAIKTKAPIIPMMYYSSPKAFKKNWLYVGEPFTLEEFYGKKGSEAMQEATDLIKQKMDEARRLVNEYVEHEKKN